VSTIYTEKNQYRVVMEVDPRYAQGPEALKDVYVITPGARRCRSPRSPATNTRIRRSR